MISLNKVTKVYQEIDKENVILEDISLKVEDGEFVCLVGPSGCGKTTILRMIAGLEQPSSGQILDNDKPIIGPGQERGLVFQQYSLFPWRNVEDNVVFGLEVQGIDSQKNYQKAEKYLELVGLSDYKKSFPRELSGGMKQRVAIIRSLVNNPRTLLMDEPFSALDVYTRQNLQEELVRIWKEEKITIIFVTHNVNEAIYLGDRVVVLSPKPTHITHEIQIDIERPRDRNSKHYIKLKKEISSYFNVK